MKSFQHSKLTLEPRPHTRHKVRRSFHSGLLEHSDFSAWIWSGLLLIIHTLPVGNPDNVIDIVVNWIWLYLGQKHQRSLGIFMCWVLCQKIWIEFAGKNWPARLRFLLESCFDLPMDFIQRALKFKLDHWQGSFLDDALGCWSFGVSTTTILESLIHSSAQNRPRASICNNWKKPKQHEKRLWSRKRW